MPTDTAFTGSIPELYDRYLGPMLFEPYARDMAARFEGFSGDLLETAAGTGRVTRALAQAAPGARITATDLNAPMLEQAAARGTPSNVTWREADAQALPFADAAFDAMVCQFGVMFYPDKAAGFAEARRVLRPGARYLFSVWDDLAANEITVLVRDTVAARFPDKPPGFLARTPHGYHDKDVITAALAAAGFTASSIETVALLTPSETADAAARGLCLGSPLKAEIAAHGEEQLEPTVEAVARVLAERYGDGDPGHAVSGMGRALVVTAMG